MRKIITQTDAINLINHHASRADGKKIRIVFKRKTPKCPRCGKQSTVWSRTSNAVCNKCGVEVEYVADVKPTDIEYIGAYDRHITYWNEHYEKRCCLTGNLLWFSLDEDEYFIMR